LELVRLRALKVSLPPLISSGLIIKHELTPYPPITASIPEHQRTAWKKYHTHPFATAEDFEKEVVRHVETTLARSMFNCDETAAYAAASLAFRNRLITEWNRTQQRQTFADGKRVYYLSLEFLMGRALDNAMLNVGLKNVAKGGFPVHDVMVECANMGV
jgi:starch phosphorylase